MKNIKTEWNLSKLFNGIDDPNIKLGLDKYVAYVDKFVEKYSKEGTIRNLSDEEYLEHLSYFDDCTYLSKIWHYYSYLNSLDGQDQTILKKLSELSNFYTEQSKRCMFYIEEEKAIGSERFLEMSKKPLFKDYCLYLKNKSENLKYSLDSKTEEALMVSGNCDLHVDIYNELTSSFTFDIEIDGKIETKTDAEIGALRESSNPEIRKKAFESIRKVYASKQNQIVLGNIYSHVAKHNAKMGEYRGRDTVMQGRNSAENLTSDVVDALINNVSSAYPLYQRFLKIKAKLLGKDKISQYDLFAPISKTDSKIPFEQGLKIYLDIIKDFDEYFYKYSVDIFEQGRVDVFPKANKRGGAYASSDKNHEGYVLLNYTDTLGDVMTLAHELGHAIHGDLAQVQNSDNYHAPLSLKETASIFNETLVFEHILDNCSDEDRIGLLVSKLDDVFSTIFRQIQYIKFEREVHQSFKDGNELTYVDYNKIWRKTQVELYGDSLEFVVDETMEIGWSSIPHIFKTPFYCYTYAMGNLISYSLLAIYKEHQKWSKEQDFVYTYKEILKAGGSVAPKELLEKYGIDISSDKFYSSGFSNIEGYLVKLENLVS